MTTQVSLFCTVNIQSPYLKVTYKNMCLCQCVYAPPYTVLKNAKSAVAPIALPGYAFQMRSDLILFWFPRNYIQRDFKEQQT